MKRTFLFLAVFSLLFTGRSSAQPSRDLRDLKILDHHWTTGILGNPTDIHVKDATQGRFLVLKLWAEVPSGEATLFAPDFVLAYEHQDGQVDRADCTAIAETTEDGFVSSFNNGNVPRFSISGHEVHFAIAFLVESDVQHVDLYPLGETAPLSYGLGSSRPYSVFLTTNQGKGTAGEARQALLDGGYQVGESLGLNADATGVVIIHHPGTEVAAREISQRLTQRLKVRTTIKTFSEEGVNMSEYDVLVWLGK